MKTARQALGMWGEDRAARYLEGEGYSLVERNARTMYGELDLVVRQGSALVFVEVKTRSSTAFGRPEEAVTAQKQAHLLAAAQAYLLSHPDLEGEWRIDVIAIRRLRGLEPEIVHFENAVRG